MSPLSKLDELDPLIPSVRGSIVFLGGGEYHHFSFMLLRRFKVPLVLLLFDKHFDAFSSENGFIRCDSWLRHVLELRSLVRLIFIHEREKREGKVHFVKPEPSRILDLIGGNRVYVSIDKDVLDLPLTRWGKGWLPLERLLDILGSLPKRKIIGVDVCGEPDGLEIWKICESERVNLMILRALGVRLPAFRNELKAG